MKLTSAGTLRINFRDFIPSDNRRIPCNYHCSYCNQAHVPQVALTETDYLQARRLWDQMRPIEDRLLVRANFDGEIFADAWAQQICFYVAGLPNVSRFEFITNNSVDPDRYLHHLDPHKTVFNCSYHPEFTTIDTFISHVRKIRGWGSRAFATMVVKPQDVPQLAAIAARFTNEGILFKPLLLLGRYQPGIPRALRRIHKNICHTLGIPLVFPQAYSTKARKTIQHHYYSAPEFEHQHGKPTLGKPCWAGVEMINVFMDGTVMRCFTGTLGTVADLVSGQLRLPQAPYPCPVDTCPCPAHMIFLDEFRRQFSLDEDFVDHYLFKKEPAHVEKA